MSSRGVSISIQKLSKSFGEQLVIDGLDLTVTAGEMLAILGPSGCGKSSLLRMIAGLDVHSGGEIALDGTVLTGTKHPLRDAMAFVFQEHTLLPWRNVLSNVALPFAQKMQAIQHLLEQSEVTHG